MLLVSGLIACLVVAMMRLTSMVAAIVFMLLGMGAKVVVMVLVVCLLMLFMRCRVLLL